MAWPPILVRYGEIGIKSRQVRIQFERKLVERVEEQLLRRGVEAEVKRDYGRVFVRAADVEKALDAIRHTFGVVSASPAIETKADMGAIADVVLGLAREGLPKGAGFAVRVKRSGTHPFTSIDVAKACAERIITALPEREPHVELGEPEWEARVEVREGGAFVFQRTVKGPGGLPLGSQGRVGVLVDSPRAAHAAWLIAKRGSLPFFFAADRASAEAWLAPLAPWVPDRRVHVVEGIDALRAELAKHRCIALVTAGDAREAVERVADDKAIGAPVFRPLVGYEGSRFEALAREAELPS